MVSPPEVGELAPVPPEPIWTTTVAPAASDSSVSLAYAPPPPPALPWPPAPVAPLAPPAPPPISSTVLLAEFQSSGTVQLVPEVRKSTMVCAALVVKVWSLDVAVLPAAFLETTSK
jgi:hypothetical protein